MNRRTLLNKKANRELKKLFEEKNIKTCEAKLENCTGSFGITFAHRHKRNWYYDKQDELLWNYNQVIISCLACHIELDGDKYLTEETFEKLRGKENE